MPMAPPPGWSFLVGANNQILGTTFVSGRSRCSQRRSPRNGEFMRFRRDALPLMFLLLRAQTVVGWASRCSCSPVGLVVLAQEGQWRAAFLIRRGTRDFGSIGTHSVSGLVAAGVMV